MALEKYVVPIKSSQPLAGINTRGTITFNLGSRQRYKMDNFSHAVLYFDADKKQIVVQLTDNPKAEGALSLRKQKNTVEVSGQGFKKRFKLDFEGETLYTVKDYSDFGEGEGLSEGKKEPKSKRTRKPNLDCDQSKREYVLDENYIQRSLNE